MQTAEDKLLKITDSNVIHKTARTGN